VFGSFRQRNPYDHNDDGFSELGELKNESIGFKWYYKPVKRGEIMTSFHRIHENRRGGNDFDVPVHAADIAEWVEHWRLGGTVRWNHRPTPLFDYRFYYSYSNEDRKSYFGGLADESDAARLEALSYYGKTKSLLHLAGFQGNYRVATHLITAGLQFSEDVLLDETAAETTYHLDEAYINTGIFIQDNLHFGTNDQIELVAGARVDKHSELDNWVFSPRLNAKFKLGHDFTARAAVTTGFKPPQTYDEDLHLGGLEGSQRIIRNSADLGAEHSFSYSTGLEYLGYLKSMSVMFSLTGFVTRLNDGFTEHFVQKIGASELWERVNSDGAQVQGIELDFGIRPRSSIEVRGGFTWKKGEFDSPNVDFGTKKFLRTPDLTSNLRLNWTPHDKLRLNLSCGYIGAADVPHEVVVLGQDAPELRLERSDSFVQVDFGASYTLPINHGMDTRLNFGIRNMTNAYQKNLDWGADRDPAYVYGPSRPRTVYFGLETRF
ncbi:TonB-dependent receptor, partial [bacterium]|nr:TonB-dependent receptor [bacterium]